MLPGLQSPAPYRLRLPSAGRPEPPANGTHQEAGDREPGAPAKFETIIVGILPKSSTEIQKTVELLEKNVETFFISWFGNWINANVRINNPETLEYFLILPLHFHYLSIYYL